MSSTSAPDRVAVRTGDLTATVVDGSLREVRVNGVLALDAIYAAVRDPSWGTVAGTFTAYEVTSSDNAFAVDFTRRHGDLFEWRGRITGSDGAVTFEFDGIALRSFAANRIGLCLLHPIELAGQPVVACTGTGETRDRFPERIAPHQPFVDLRGLRYLVTDSWLDLSFEGEIFETEDHRNWTDAGWKTYCPPLDRPYPVSYAAGDRVRQVVTLGVRLEPAARVGDPRPRPADDVVLPELGLGVAAGTLSEAAIASLRDVRPAYLQVDLALADDWQGRLDNAASQAAALGAALDVAVDTDGRPWDELAFALARHEVRRVAVFDAVAAVTTPGIADALRATLRKHGSTALVGGGSHLWFAELNRAQLPLDELEFVTYGISPQLHHFDDDSVMDTLLAQVETVRDARRIAGDLPVVIGAVRLHPHQADPRQRTEFLATWTAGSVLALVLGGAAAVTYFQTVGDEGIVGESPYPVHRVFTALAGQAGRSVRQLVSSPRNVACFEVGGVTVVANLREVKCVLKLPDRVVRLAPRELTMVGG